MATLTYVKFQNFIEAVFEGKHNFATAQLRVYLSNAAPNAATNAVKADLAEITTGNGYAGSLAVTTTASSQTGGTYSLAVTLNSTVTATGSIGPYRYIVLFNDTATNKDLIGYWDLGSAITLTAGDTHTLTASSPLITAS